MSQDGGGGGGSGRRRKVNSGHLPRDAILLIISFMDPVTARSCARINWEWRDCMLEDWNWEEICQRKGLSLNDAPIRRKRFRYKNPYKNRLIAHMISQRNCNDLKYTPDITQIDGHQGAVFCMQFNHDMMITGGGNGTHDFLRSWDLKSSEKKIGKRSATGSRMMHHFIGHEGVVMDLQFAYNRLVTCSADCTVKLWNCTRPQPGHYDDDRRRSPVYSINAHDNVINCLKWENATLVTGSSDKTCKVWDLERGRCLSVLEHHSIVRCADWQTTVPGLSQTPHSLSAGTNGLIVCLGSGDGSLRLWDPRMPAGLSGTVMYGGHGGMVRCLQIDQASYTILSGSWDGSIKRWDMRRWPEPIPVYTINDHLGRINAMQMDVASNKLLTAGGDKTVRIFDLASGNPIRIIEEDRPVQCLQYTGEVLGTATGGSRGGVTLYDFSARTRSKPGAPKKQLVHRFVQSQTLEKRAVNAPIGLTEKSVQARSAPHSLISQWNHITDRTRPSNQYRAASHARPAYKRGGGGALINIEPTHPLGFYANQSKAYKGPRFSPDRLMEQQRRVGAGRRRDSQASSGSGRSHRSSQWDSPSSRSTTSNRSRGGRRRGRRRRRGGDGSNRQLRASASAEANLGGLLRRDDEFAQPSNMPPWDSSVTPRDQLGKQIERGGSILVSNHDKPSTSVHTYSPTKAAKKAEHLKSSKQLIPLKKSSSSGSLIESIENGPFAQHLTTTDEQVMRAYLRAKHTRQKHRVDNMNAAMERARSNFMGATYGLEFVIPTNYASLGPEWGLPAGASVSRPEPKEKPTGLAKGKYTPSVIFIPRQLGKLEPKHIPPTVQAVPDVSIGKGIFHPAYNTSTSSSTTLPQVSPSSNSLTSTSTAAQNSNQKYQENYDDYF